jgi:NADH-quinone oxidoreductase subunit A
MLVIFFTSPGGVYMLQVYFPLFLMIFFVTALALVIVALSYLLGKRVPTKEKMATYECGNEPFDDARARFPVKFYLIAILGPLFIKSLRCLA